MQNFKRKHRSRDLAGIQRALRRLHTQCERTKWTLSPSTQATIEIDSLIDGINFSCSLSHARVEEPEGYLRRALGNAYLDQIPVQQEDE